MAKKILVDAGPLIALFDRDDIHHANVKAFIQKFRGTLLTTHAVMTEVCHLLDFHRQAQLGFLRWAVAGGLMLLHIDQADLQRVVDLSEKYADVPMDYADATLVVLAERQNIREVLSIDSDFSIYRRWGKDVFSNPLVQ